MLDLVTTGNQIIDYLHNNNEVVAGLLGMIFTWAKVTPTEESGALLTKIQNTLDFVAKIFELLGKFVHEVAMLISNLIRSDGTGGTP